MHVVTFYSFKGGVGRTMALVNVAAYLATQGRKVLVVDFDLEAPGLTTYDLPKPGAKPTAGIVEFVLDYLQTGQVPDVSNYVYRSDLLPGADLLVMPAGAIDDTYKERFRSIDFGSLYADQNGYLLMEDLRKQWQSTLGVDYVFIDSRTGYSDISGICTRQLPDAVCLMFVPNQQNLAGLLRVKAEIDAQTTHESLRHPDVLYVASNVPDLDDVNDVLSGLLQNYKDQLGFKELTAKIGQYRSLDLLKQEVFTIKHQKTSLAKDYVSLAKAIARTNLEDYSASLDQLKAFARQLAGRQQPLPLGELTQRINVITAKHDDAEVYYWAGCCKGEMGDWEDARALLTQSIEGGNDNAEVHIQRARFSSLLGRRDEAAQDARWVLNQEAGAELPAVLAALHMLLGSGNLTPEEAVQFPAIRPLTVNDRLFLSHSLYDAKAYPDIARLLLRDVFNKTDLNESQREQVVTELANASIAVGELEDAVEILESSQGVHSRDEVISFNLAMAKYWLQEHDAAKSLMLSVVDKLKGSQDGDLLSLNQMQCLAFAYWVLGDGVMAKQLLTKVKGRASFQPRPTFSCWRYVNCLPFDFRRDLDEMSRLFEGADVVPRFMRNRKVAHA